MGDGLSCGAKFRAESCCGLPRCRTVGPGLPGGDGLSGSNGTGGTLRGLYEAFAGAGCRVRAHAAIPRDGGLLSSDPGCCSLRFSSDVPGVVERISEIYGNWECPDLVEWQIDDRDCLRLTRRLWAMGFPVGPSSGLNLAAAFLVAEQLGPDCRVVTVFPDRMERYFSHKVFEEIKTSAATDEIDQ